MNVTFKKHLKETGLSAVGNPWPSTDIKIRGKVVGIIAAPSWTSEDNLWRCRMMVKYENSFTWITLRKKHESEPEAREWLKKNIYAISKMYDLYYQEA